MKFFLSTSRPRGMVWALSALAGLSAGFLAHWCRPADRPAALAAASRHNAREAIALPKRPTAPFSTAGKTAALAERLALVPRIERWLLLAAAVEKAGLEEMPDLLRLAAGDERAQEMIATRWAEKNPRHLWQSMIADHKPARKSGGFEAEAFGMPYGALASVLFASWVEQDASAVRETLARAEGVPELRYLRRQAMTPLFRKDPEAALRLADQWSGWSVSADSELVREWAEKDPRRAADVLRECGDMPAAITAGGAIGELWGAADPAAALAYADACFKGTMRLVFARGAIRSWAEKDPRAALAFLATQSDAGFRGTLAAAAVRALAKTDPAEAQRWAEEHLQGEAKRDAIWGAIAEESSRDPQAARERALALPTGAIKNYTVAWLAMSRLQQSGVRPAVDWLLSLAEPEARQAGFDRVAEQMYSKNAREAAEIAAGPLAEAVPKEFTESAARNYADTDPRAAMAWVDTLPADRQAGAWRGALDKWLQNRPLEAAEWFSQMPAGPERAALLDAAARYVCYQPADTAAVVISRLRPDELPAVRREIEGLVIGPNDWRDAAWKAEMNRLLGP